ncbi:MAG: hypothetical protein ACYC6L_12120 [Anaerolineae bacterium]
MKRISSKISRHPRLVTWLVLAFGMVVIVLLTSREVPFTWMQRSALVLIAILLAGGCAWIIHWD